MTLTDGPRPPGRLDHRRRRLGLRHRLRRAGPGPLVGPQRQHPRPRHRGLLQHGRPGLQVHPARRRGEVRRRRQGDGQEGPGRDRPLLRQRLRGPDQPRRQRRPVDQGAPRGRGVGRPLARHRLRHVHRARHRHVDVDEPPEGRREVRLLAALPVPAERGGGRHAVQAGLREADDPDQRVRGQRDAVRDPPADRSRSVPQTSPRWPRPTRTSAGATTSSWPASSAACRTSCTPTPRPRRTRTPPRSSRPWPRQPRRATGRETSRDRRPAHPLPRAGPALAARLLVVPLHRRARDGAPPGGRRRGGARAPLAVRGGDRQRGDPADPGARGRDQPVRRGARLLPGDRLDPLGQRPLRRPHRDLQARARRSRSSRASTPRRPAAGSATRARSRRPGPTPWSSTCTTSWRTRG